MAKQSAGEILPIIDRCGHLAHPDDFATACLRSGWPRWVALRPSQRDHCRRRSSQMRVRVEEQFFLRIEVAGA
jgi:hypothetical protein